MIKRKFLHNFLKENSTIRHDNYTIEYDSYNANIYLDDCNSPAVAQPYALKLILSILNGHNGYIYTPKMFITAKIIKSRIHDEWVKHELV